MDWVFAKDLLKRHGKGLIGRTILTKEVGDHPAQHINKGTNFC